MSSSRSSSSTPTSRPIPLPEPGSTPKVPSPLNPASTSAISLPVFDDKPIPPSPAAIHRVQSTSALPDEESTNLSISLIASHAASSSPALSTPFDSENLKSTFRERSRSPGRGSGGLVAQDSDAGLSASWWNEKHVSRPWHDVPKRKRTVMPEHTEALESTRRKVAQAVISALGTGVDIVHEALYIGVELLDFAPVPGLQTAAKTLLSIWDAAQEVDMNCLASLRLTERCADIMISVRHEIFDAGDVVRQELEAPILKLEESFLTTHRFMLKQTNRPWLKRYLKRDEIKGDIATCDSALRDALGLFSVSIQIRILKQVEESDRRRQAEMKALTAIIQDTIASGASKEAEMSNDDQTSPLELTKDPIMHFKAPTNTLGLFHDDAADGSMTPTEAHHSSDIIPAIQSIHQVQNTLDAASDTSDLRQLMRAALQTSSDAEMVEVLQIGRQEMPDAIKTLQRALERLAERDGDLQESAGGRGVIVRKATLKEGVQGTEVGLGRTTTIASIESSSSSGDSLSGDSSDTKRRDTLDREFIESGIDALRRMSRGVETSLPSWTITKYEVDRDEKIGIGFFSDVYKGTWRGRTVAIKVLAESTPRKLFIREIGIWKALRHANVLQLYGASSACGDPPWFFVSPYLKNGTLVEHLKRVEHEERPAGLGIGPGAGQPVPISPYRSPGGRAVSLPAWKAPQNSGLGQELTANSVSPGKAPSRENGQVQREWDLFRFMHEIAKGMEYLHGKGVLHSDLKAANVLVDDKYRCVISDFGQSEMKSEAYRISGTAPPHGTLRWQSPELMAGESQLSPAVDVWAFAICCVEILSMGRIPWPLMDDQAVRHFVLKENTRPPIPRNSRFNTPGLQDILRVCWSASPEQRPPFTKISRDLKLIRKSFGQDVFESPRLPTIEDIPEHGTSPSPDVRPSNLPFLKTVIGPPPDDILTGSLGSDGTFHTARNSTPSPDLPGAEQPKSENTVATEEFKMPQPVIYTPGPSNPSSRTSSLILPSKYSDGHTDAFDFDGYESPPPMDERTAQTKNERRYRFLLTHEYNPSLVLPLWHPTPVELGAVGYLSKPRGEFITLFNAYSPVKGSHPAIKVLPSIEGYGHTPQGYHRDDRRTVAQKVMDMVYGGSLTFRNFSEKVSRRYSFPLKAGHKVAYMLAEITEYRYMEIRDAPKKWFQLHVDTIVQTYGRQHQIQKEDIFLVTGTLRAPNYALFLSHSHPEGHAHFSIYSDQGSGQPWGTFTTDSVASLDQGPGSDSEDETPRLSASKVSSHGGPWATVLLARLRFKPDALEPTSR